MRRYLTSAVFFLISATVALAQYEVENTESGEDQIQIPTVKVKPRLGIGMGTFLFQGETAGKGGGYLPGTANMGYKLFLSSDITSYLEAELYSIFGGINVMDYDAGQVQNFQSQIRTGGVALSYNFGNFIPRDAGIRPTLSVGVETMEFLSKMDLMDRDGNYYYRWSDGSIRNLPEAWSNIEASQIVTPDNIYETDLRDQDLDGFGKHPDRTLSIPVGLSAQWLLSDRFRVRFGSQMHFTMSDLVDNMSSGGNDDRQGSPDNDRFIFTSLGISYDLNITPKPGSVPQPLEIMDENGEMLMVMIDEDSDKDGVNDFVDKCLGTPEGVEVDEFGCALDEDKDGVPDYRDQETWTAMNAHVNSEGVTITDEEFLEKYLMWTDSIPWKTTVWREDYAKLESDMNHWTSDMAQSYSVSVPTQSNGLTQAEINLLLSYKDIAKFTQNGEEMILVGKFDKLPEAVAQKIDLENKGIRGKVMQKDGDQLVDKSNEAESIELEMLAQNEWDGETHYRIQLGAFRNDLSENIFAGINDLIVIRGDDGLTRYMSGSFETAQQAADYKTRMLLEGFDGAFITAYNSGQRVTLSESGMQTTGNTPDLTYDTENHSINPDQVKFRVQLGAYTTQIPTEVLDKYLELGNVKPMRSNDDMVKYVSAPIGNYVAAVEYLENALDHGINDAFIVGEFNGNLISAEEARMLKGSDEIQALEETED